MDSAMYVNHWRAVHPDWVVRTLIAVEYSGKRGFVINFTPSKRVIPPVQRTVHTLIIWRATQVCWNREILCRKLLGTSIPKTSIHEIACWVYYKGVAYV